MDYDARRNSTGNIEENFKLNQPQFDDHALITSREAAILLEGDNFLFSSCSMRVFLYDGTVVPALSLREPSFAFETMPGLRRLS